LSWHFVVVSIGDVDNESLELRPREFATHTGTAGIEPIREIQSRQMVCMSTAQMDFQMFLLSSHSPPPGFIAEWMNSRVQSCIIMKSRVICGECIFNYIYV
jgi:hypothetical protein